MSTFAVTPQHHTGPHIPAIERFPSPPSHAKECDIWAAMVRIKICPALCLINQVRAAMATAAEKECPCAGRLVIALIRNLVMSNGFWIDTQLLTSQTCSYDFYWHDCEPHVCVCKSRPGMPLSMKHSRALGNKPGFEAGQCKSIARF